VAINSNSSVPSTEVTSISPFLLHFLFDESPELHLTIDETRWL
jgi:hypothetical protein